MSFEETELRLGLPGNNNGRSEMTRKRGLFHEEEYSSPTHQTILTMPDLKLNLISSQSPPPPKAEVVGWPPIRSYRKKRLGAVQKGSKEEEISDEEKKVVKVRFVKVSLEGAPYLRKVDLNMFNSYTQLSHALAKFFAAFTIGNCGMKDFMNETKLIDLLNGSDYVPTYQDKDGDWMLLGDVPWQMFVESCKRVRIMKGKEAIGLANGVEKCKKYQS